MISENNELSINTNNEANSLNNTMPDNTTNNQDNINSLLVNIEKTVVPKNLLADPYESIKEHLIKLSPSIHKCAFIGWHLVKLVSVYDGDTVNILLVLGVTGFKFGLRIYGIDTAEMNSYNPILKAYATKSRDFLQSLLKPDNLYVAYIIDNDKYGGRLIGDIYYTDSNGDFYSISNIMLSNKYALPYNGKKKASEKDWIKFISGGA
jgi:endonuclease YncB( thermonuclease family)